MDQIPNTARPCEMPAANSGFRQWHWDEPLSVKVSPASGMNCQL